MLAAPTPAARSSRVSFIRGTDPLEDGPDFHHTLTGARYQEMHLPQNVDADSDKNYEDAGDGDHCKHPVVQNTNFCNTNVVIWRELKVTAHVTRVVVDVDVGVGGAGLVRLEAGVGDGGEAGGQLTRRRAQRREARAAAALAAAAHRVRDGPAGGAAPHHAGLAAL